MLFAWLREGTLPAREADGAGMRAAAQAKERQLREAEKQLREADAALAVRVAAADAALQQAGGPAASQACASPCVGVPACSRDVRFLTPGSLAREPGVREVLLGC